MKNASQLREDILSLDHREYPAYKSLKGAYRFKNYILYIDHVQGDPFASPSHIRVEIDHKTAGFPGEYYRDHLTRVTLADYLLRQFARESAKYSGRARGSGKSGVIQVSRCGQVILERSACRVDEKKIMACFYIGFPANGRSINAGELEKVLFQYLPDCVEKAFFYGRQDPGKLQRAIWLAEDQSFLREALAERKMVAFVADGSILPRESGVSDRPMKESIPFQSPETLRISLELPHRGTITGMGIPQGITLIVGGGYHGKSTLLTALQEGVYNHIAGDGREYVITDATAQKLRSEDGRAIRDIDISLFINDLPNHKDTHSFSTEDASGSTSQAAGIVEGMEAGSKLILLDEDTSATNFMVRDTFMQSVIARENEPITPFIERARDLFEKAGISTILVAGSSGAFFHIADLVLQMDEYIPRDITGIVKPMLSRFPLTASKPGAFRMPGSRRVMTQPLAGRVPEGRNWKGESSPGWENPGEEADVDDDSDRGKNRWNRPAGEARGRERIKIRTHGADGFSYGHEEVDLRYLEQLRDPEQTAALGLLLKYASEHLIDGRRTLSEIADNLSGKLEKGAFSFLEGETPLPGGYAVPRRQEIYACLNRCRRK